MTKKTKIWMPLYIGDYLADTKRLSTEQHGAYLLLIMDYWRCGSLPNDDKVLAQITLLSAKKFSNIKEILMGFFVLENNEWKHPRIDKELAKSLDNKEKKTNAANIRWGKSDADGYAGASAKGMQTVCPSPSPSPSSIKSNTSMSESAIPTCPQEKILELWKKHLPHLTQPRTWEGTRPQTLRQRWVQASKKSAYSDGYNTFEDGLIWWNDFFNYIAKDTALATGFETNGRIWKPDLEWVLTAKNFQKIIDGKYNK
jgi:uncharacterized protein YdaU (DUF1376 family)